MMKFACFRYWLAVLAVLATAGGLLVSSAAAEGLALPLQDGDRVALVGSAFVERLQNHGYLETELVCAYKDRAITFRNLGWSGDDVFGVARAVFGSPQEGFERRMRDLWIDPPTVVLVCYGANEANAGPGGVARFEQGLARLLDALLAKEVRVAVLSPPKREKLPPPLPDPSEFNKTLAQYAAAAQRLAKARGCQYVEIDFMSAGDAKQPLTDNTIHLSKYGHWRTAPRIAKALQAPQREGVRLTYSPPGDSYAPNLDSKQINWKEAGKNSFALELTPNALPRPPAPDGTSDKLHEFTVKELPPGKYRLTIDGREAVVADADEWAKGVSFACEADVEQVEKLRRAINEKNELFFHRHRPQNETYLYLFRKHEQGNNAKETPQFDPLIAEKEAEIAKLRKPVARTYKLSPVEEAESPQ